MSNDQERRDRWQAITNRPVMQGIGIADASGAAVGGAQSLHGLATQGPRTVNGGIAAAARPGGLALNTLGLLTAPISIGQGIVNLMNGDTSQGVLDVASGGLGLASAGMGLAGIACPPLGIAAAVGGLAAFGNERAQENGWYGRDPGADGNADPNGRARTFFGSIGSESGEAFAAGRRLYGNNLPERVIGNTVGGLAAAGRGAYAGARNTGAAAWGGATRLADTLAGPVASTATTLANGRVGRGIRSLYAGGDRPAAPVPAADLMNYNMF